MDERFPICIRDNVSQVLKGWSLLPMPRGAEGQATCQAAHDPLHGLGAGSVQEAGRPVPTPAQCQAQEDTGQALAVSGPARSLGREGQWWQLWEGDGSSLWSVCLSCGQPSSQARDSVCDADDGFSDSGDRLAD
ncbi:SOX9 [Crotalus adamanteus]|uniref:SOX9 n=1 Tax=Crotalus adamanteus TaxID=8729 RepID=A0AAW1C6W8_CROAD